MYICKCTKKAMKSKRMCSEKKFIAVFFLVVVLMLPSFVLAQDKNGENEKTVKYKSETSLSLVLTRGNNKAFSFSFDTDQNLEFNKNRINLKGRFIDSSSNGEKTAEIYSSQLKYDRKISSRVYLLGFVRYERNKLSGYLSRIGLSAGGGISWIKNTKHQVTSELAFGWNNERENQLNFSVIAPSQVWAQTLSSSFISSVMTHKWTGRISESAQIMVQETLFLNLEEPKDFRLNSHYEISSSINRNLALKTSVEIIYEHHPVEGYKNTDTFILSSVVLKF